MKKLFTLILTLLAFSSAIQATEKEQLVEQLYDIGVIQFGTFTLKSGITSLIYVDMHKIISHPNVLKKRVGTN